MFRLVCSITGTALSMGIDNVSGVVLLPFGVKPFGFNKLEKRVCFQHFSEIGTAGGKLIHRTTTWYRLTTYLTRSFNQLLAYLFDACDHPFWRSRIYVIINLLVSSLARSSQVIRLCIVDSCLSNS